MATFNYVDRRPSTKLNRRNWTIFIVILIVASNYFYNRTLEVGEKQPDIMDAVVNDGFTVGELANLADQYMIWTREELENRAIDLARRLHGSQTLVEQRKELLCAIFLKITPTSMQNLLANIKHSQAECEWVVVVYAYNETTDDPVKQQFLKELLATNGKSPPVVHFEYSTPRHLSVSLVRQKIEVYRAKKIEKKHNQHELKIVDDAYKFIDHPKMFEATNLPHNRLYNPKSILLFPILPYLMDYNSVWFMDGDISLLNFSFPAFRDILRNGFDKTDKILISQPLIAESTQSYKYVNRENWRNSEVLATKTGFVEIQAPRVDSRYLEWFILSFLVPIINPSHILGADWGIDQLFCRAAGVFKVLRDTPSAYPQFQTEKWSSALESDALPYCNYSDGLSSFKQHMEENPFGTSCAIVTSPLTEINHADQREINRLMGYKVKVALNRRMMKIMREAFSTFHLTGIGELADPLYAESGFQRVTVLRPEEPQMD